MDQRDTEGAEIKQKATPKECYVPFVCTQCHDGWCISISIYSHSVNLITNDKLLMSGKNVI